MIYRNNLSKYSDNSYFEVTSPFNIYIPIGHYKTNTFIGSSQFYGTAYKNITLNIGDYLYDLFGGVYVNYNNKMHRATLNISEKSIFEKEYGSNIEIFDLSKLKKINKPSINFQFINDTSIIPDPGIRYGRSIDCILK